VFWNHSFAQEGQDTTHPPPPESPNAWQEADDPGPSTSFRVQTALIQTSFSYIFFDMVGKGKKGTRSVDDAVIAGSGMDLHRRQHAGGHWVAH
jgi:hypothetical protein